MGPCVQMSNEVSEDVILVLCKFDDMILLLLLVVERVFLKIIHLHTFTAQDLETKTKYESPQELHQGPFKTWGPSSQSILTFQASFTHYNWNQTYSDVCLFFSQSITGASITYNPIFCFLLDPPAKPPKKPLKPQIHLFFQVSCRNSTWMPWKVFLGSRDIVWILDGFHWTEKFG